MALNYLPFARKELVVVPARKADRVQTGGFAVTDIARMATGGTRRVIIHDITVQQPRQDAYWPFAKGDDNLIRIRIGVDGRNYLTEDLYDWRVFADQQVPGCSVWDWSCGKRTPYRLYPGQKMSVMMAPSPSAPFQVANVVPLAAMFNGMKVRHGSPVGTKEGEPILLYGMKVPTAAETYSTSELMLIESMRFQCPRDNPVDLYSVSLSEYDLYTEDWPIYITDGNDRPLWDNRTYTNIINTIVSPISMGYGGLLLEPDETLRIDLENGMTSNNDDLTVAIMYRGVLEVDDGR
jgi:hypothetical protein